jgi:hypothetical protein
MYAEIGRPSIPPEPAGGGLEEMTAHRSLLGPRRTLLPRKDERLQYDLLFKSKTPHLSEWFLDLKILDPALSASLRAGFDASVFSKNTPWHGNSS